MKNDRHILLVEDDPNLGTLLHEYLQVKGYRVDHATDGQQGFDHFRKKDYDFIILDVMMPKKDGFTLAKDIRSIDQEVPILFLTAKTMKEDTLHGFKVGADDYMTKPFSMEELLLRMQAILKRTNNGEEEKDEGPIQIGLFTFDPQRQMLLLDGEEDKLTTKESQLLHLLCKKKNDILDRSTALNMVWGDDTYHNGRSMDVYITKLRKHLRPDPAIEIVNVHGQGFKLLVKS
ncbi:MAG: response regulator transcription factor [Flavobacteriales bacterium]|nr:response regulator transcription factor [Flavobacteriales bacterium]